MDTTHERERHTTSSIAEQEMFFSSGSGAHGQTQHQAGQHDQNRWYDDFNNESPTVPAGSGVPAVNIIPATPTTVRSNSTRSQWSYKDPNEQKHMTGALPEVEEEDNIYDPPSPSEDSPVESKASTHEMPPSSNTQHQSAQEPVHNVSPISEPAVPAAPHYDAPAVPHYTHHDAGHAYPQLNGHPTPEEKGKSPEPPAKVEEQTPPPNSKPSEPAVADYYTQDHGSGVDPAVQEQEDRDYAMALALQEEEESERPPLPQRPSKASSGWDSSNPPSSQPLSAEEQDRAYAMRLQEEEEGGPRPPLPARPHPDAVAAMLAQQQEPQPFTRTPSIEGIMPPPKRQGSDFGADDPNNPIHYARDPHKLIAYLVPFPKPWLGAKAPTDAIPTRFLVYTPPPPPLQAPPEGAKEAIAHKVQRKWQAEVRQAKSSDAKTTSWAGFRAKCTRGVDKAMQYTTTSNLDFLARVEPPPKATSSSSGLARKLSLKSKKKKGDKAGEGKDKDGKGKESDEEKVDESKDATPVDETPKEEKVSGEKARENPFEEKFSEEKARDEKGGKSLDEVRDKEEEEEVKDDDPAHGSHQTKKTVGVEEMIFVYPPNMNMSPEEMRAEFVNTMLRTKSKAQRDAIIATGLLPVSLAIDLLMIAISGLFEINAVWAYFTIKGTKTARSVTKRIASTSKKPETIDPEKPEAEMEKEDKLKLTFKPAYRIDLLSRYLQAECHRVDSRLFPRYTMAPTEIDCLEAIGWSPAKTRGQQNWEDEAWEVNDVKDDLKVVMHKAAKEWCKWCNRYEKNPEKSLNK